jgi:hypothetical protein
LSASDTAQRPLEQCENFDLATRVFAPDLVLRGSWRIPEQVLACNKAFETWTIIDYDLLHFARATIDDPYVLFTNCLNRGSLLFVVYNRRCFEFLQVTG